jgi:hypothetical protein
MDSAKTILPSDAHLPNFRFTASVPKDADFAHPLGATLMVVFPLIWLLQDGKSTSWTTGAIVVGR